MFVFGEVRANLSCRCPSPYWHHRYVFVPTDDLLHATPRTVPSLTLHNKLRNQQCCVAFDRRVFALLPRIGL